VSRSWPPFPPFLDRRSIVGARVVLRHPDVGGQLRLDLADDGRQDAAREQP